MNANFFKLILFTSALFFSCKPSLDENSTAPDNILTENQLIIVLTDSYLAEGASGINIKNVSGNQFDSIYRFNPLKDHGISKTKFDSTMLYYTSHPKKLKLVYDKVLDKLSAYQASKKLE
jgi:hypothetical protein